MHAPLFTLSPTRFAEIQAKLGLDDEGMGRKLYRIPDGPQLVRDFRTGTRRVTEAVAGAMLGFEEAFEESAAQKAS